MSHELRTPLNAVLGFTELVLDTELMPKQRQDLEIVSSRGKDLLELIQGLLDHSQIESGHITFNPTEVNLRNMINDITRSLTSRIQDKGLNIHAQVDSDVSPVIVIDSLRLRQIIENLVNNAMKFTDQGGITIKVLLEPDALPDVSKAPFMLHRDEYTSFKTITFQVRDTGIGIPELHQDRIFEHFTQADGSMTRAFGGAGLGLAICKQLVERMGGCIHVESEVGKGSVFTFSFYLPCIETCIPMQKCKGMTTPPISKKRTLKLKGLKILLAEDDLASRVLTEKKLHRDGHDVICVSNGQEAVKRVKSERFDLVLMDIQMPIMDGLEASRSIVAQVDEDWRPPIIAITAHALEEDKERCLDAGMDGYISKPIQGDKLLRTIQHFNIDSISSEKKIEE